MKKKQLILLVILSIVGSFITFYAVNLLMSDIANYATKMYIISTFPMFTFVLEYIGVVICLARYIKNPIYKKALIKRYTIIALVISVIGLITSILSGTVVYHDYLAPYPFSFYSLIFTIVHILIIGCCVYGLKVCIPKLDDDPESKKITPIYVLYTAVIWFLVLYGFNKFGAVLWCGTYITFRYMVQTDVFYDSLCLPLLCVALLYALEIKLIKSKKVLKIISIILLVMAIGFSFGAILMGALDSRLIAAVSPAVPLERLASFPMDSLIIRPIISIALSIVYFIKVKKA